MLMLDVPDPLNEVIFAYGLLFVELSDITKYGSKAHPFVSSIPLNDTEPPDTEDVAINSSAGMLIVASVDAFAVNVPALLPFFWMVSVALPIVGLPLKSEYAPDVATAAKLEESAFASTNPFSTRP